MGLDQLSDEWLGIQSQHGTGHRGEDVSLVSTPRNGYSRTLDTSFERCNQRNDTTGPRTAKLRYSDGILYRFEYDLSFPQHPWKHVFGV
jgi:hypothetical protein